MSAMVPAEDCEFQPHMQHFNASLEESSWYQSPVQFAAKNAFDSAAYYEQLALMLEAENLAFQMAQAFPFGMPVEQTLPFAMPEEEVPEMPPGLDFIAPPPGLNPVDFGNSPALSAKNDNDAEKISLRQICWFQNRYHHAKAEDRISPCAKGDDCQFCHAFHPKMRGRGAKEGLCSCATHILEQHRTSSDDSASTRLGDDCSSGDESSSVSSSKGSKVVPPVPTPEESPHPWRKKKGKLLDVKAVDAQTESTESPPVIRQICYFQNRWHNRQDGQDFEPCSKGDDCLFCHEIHPLIKRRNDKAGSCSCPVKHQ
eukprot:TRINITY_DN110344_c0_g1_i1.p1 TRINITY_DN110344_c0_g1~~TRINITY_DN110344_c0_g1_i1.p1  ORF type:complete len:313 (+),score=57.60 TRINITY_DN110344_c0_g1_i1:92-1030(+)